MPLAYVTGTSGFTSRSTNHENSTIRESQKDRTEKMNSYHLILLIFSIATAVHAQNSCNLSDSERCPLNGLIESQTTLIYPPPDQARCFDSSAAPDGNPYFFQLIKGDPKKVLIFFQGGGLCFDSRSCGSQSVLKTPIASSTGVFDLSNPDNPFQDWTIVHVLYCSGDLHIGSKINDGVNFNGRNNVRLVLDWVYENIDDPDRVVVGGCSAGSLGAQFWSNSILQHYSSAISSVLFDGYMGYVDGDDFSAVVTSIYGMCQNATEWGWSEDLKAQCQAGTIGVQDIMLEFQALSRGTPFAYVSHKDDSIQRGRSTDPQRVYYPKQQAFMKEYINKPSVKENNVLTYYLNGAGHCELQSEGLYSLNNGDSQPTLKEFVTHLATYKPGDSIKSSCIPGSSVRKNLNCDHDLLDAKFGNSSNIDAPSSSSGMSSPTTPEESTAPVSPPTDSEPTAEAPVKAPAGEPVPTSKEPASPTSVSSDSSTPVNISVVVLIGCLVLLLI